MEYDCEYYCPKCNAILNYQDGFDPDALEWTCSNCGQHLFGDNVFGGERFPNVYWYCDQCGALLNSQPGFTDCDDTWTCTECGFTNSISENEISDSNETRTPTYGELIKSVLDLAHDGLKIYAESKGIDLASINDTEDDEDNDDEDEYDEDNDDEDDYDYYDNYVESSDEDDYSNDLNDDFSSFDTENDVQSKNDIISSIVSSLNTEIQHKNEELEIEKARRKQAEKEAEQERYYRELQEKILNDEKLAKRKEWWKLHSKTVIALILITAISLTIRYLYERNKRLTILNYSSTELIGKNYEEVDLLLKTDGFTNIRLISSEDIDRQNPEIDGSVYRIEIEGKNNFETGTKFPYDTKIKVTYHSYRNINLPDSSKNLKGKDYRDVLQQFEEAGFIDVEGTPIADLVFGWLKKPNEIEQISIGDLTEFDKNEVVPANVKIKVFYHVFKQ